MSATDRDADIYLTAILARRHGTATAAQIALLDRIAAVEEKARSPFAHLSVATAKSYDMFADLGITVGQ